MSQLRFSQLIDVPVSTVKAIENNQRSLNRRIFERVEQATGIRWDKQTEQWLYYPEEPVFKEWREIVKKRPSDWEQHVERLYFDLRELFSQVPDSHWHRFFFRFQDIIDECRVEIDQDRKRTKGHKKT